MKIFGDVVDVVCGVWEKKIVIDIVIDCIEFYS